MPGNRRERFERLFREHGDAVLRYAVRRDPVAAEDVVAEVFLVASAAPRRRAALRCR